LRLFPLFWYDARPEIASAGRNFVNKIPFVDLSRAHAPIKAALHAAASRVIDSGHYIGGGEVKQFEKELASWLGVGETCSVACATSGLFAVLRCAGIGPGDEVITTVHTAIATAEAISLTGARVVFCDLVPAGYNLDPQQVETLITPRTKAIVPVHLYGLPADMTALLDIARRHQLLLVEDCAQAQGAYYQGRMVGTLGDAAVFSFFPSKNLGGFGDGGAVIARAPELLRKIRMFSNHGRESKYVHEFEGINSRLDAIQAAMLRVCLPLVHDWNRQRREAAGWYLADLAGLPGLRLPHALPDTVPVYHVFVICVPDREGLKKHLELAGIETGVHYPYALNTLPAYAHLGRGAGSFPRAEEACRTMLSLPLFPGITREEVHTVSQAVRAFLRGGN
jgi:dTDP-4-amino-4,6-dideoxygalactose transaminase